MDDLIRILATERKRLAEDNEKVTAAMKMVEATPLWADWKTARGLAEQSRAVVADLEEQVRALAVAHFGDTGDKHPHAAVGIKLFTFYDYDPISAKRYCVEHLPTALTLDGRKFERAAEVLDLDFVKIGKEPRAQIASDLTDWEGAA
jgi:hypothetical protein